MRTLVTHSLLTSWRYALRDDPYEDATSERDSMAEFLQTLRREPTKTTEAMLNGNEFEDLITAIVHGDEKAPHYIKDERVMVDVNAHPWADAAAIIASRIRGGQLQFKAVADLTVDGQPVLLHGRLDVLLAGTIYDIKFTKNYDPGKFYDSSQHPAYFELIPEADTFTYLVSNGTWVWTETYRRDETRSIVPEISNFFAWLKAAGLWELYCEKWAAK